MESLYVILISALPIFELRAGIPVAIYYGFKPWEAYFLATFGNFLPIPFLLLFLNKLLELVKKFRTLWRLYELVYSRVERKRELIDKYGYIGLTLFVSVPLPVTGAWTGCLLAFLLGLKKLKAMIAILVGIMIAGIIVLTPVVGIASILI